MDLMDFRSILSDTIAVLVIYKVKIEDSETFLSLSDNYKDINLRVDLVVYDNSPSPMMGCEKRNLHNWNIHYIHDRTNPGVSKAYNYGFEVARKMKKKWILLLDQDSRFPPDAFLKYFLAMKANPQAVLFAPLLVSKTGRISSPCAYYVKHGFPLNKQSIIFGEYGLKNRSILNSGILIKTSSFEMIGGYDEKLKLDFSDYKFINAYKKHHPSFVLADIKCCHDLSSSNNDLASSLSRFQHYCDGARNSIESFSEMLALLTLSLLRAGKMIIKFKNPGFLIVWYKFFLRPLIASRRSGEYQ